MNQALTILDWIKNSKHIVITSHKSPDGDSIGSSLGLLHFINKFNTACTICHPDPAPSFLKWLDGADGILTLETDEQAVQEHVKSCDLLFCLDYNDPSRTGDKMGQMIIDSNAKKVMFDHHLNPSDFVDIAISDTGACSTSQLIYELIAESGNKNLLDKSIGTPLYLGIMTDTGSFRFNSVKPNTHRIIADLLEAGVQHDEIHEKTFDVNTVQKLKLRGFAISEKLVELSDLKAAYISLSSEELERFDHEKGDTEGLVNVALSLEKVKIAAFFSEKDGEIKISFRSKGKDHPINGLAGKYFQGGGHANASGGKFEGKLEDAITLFKKVLPEYVS